MSAYVEGKEATGSSWEVRAYGKDSLSQCLWTVVRMSFVRARVKSSFSNLRFMICVSMTLQNCRRFRLILSRWMSAFFSALQASLVT